MNRACVLLAAALLTLSAPPLRAGGHNDPDVLAAPPGSTAQDLLAPVPPNPRFPSVPPPPISGLPHVGERGTEEAQAAASPAPEYDAATGRDTRVEWARRRSPEEVSRAIEEALALPDESELAAPVAAAATTAWTRIGLGITDPDGVHHKAGRVRALAYAYDPAQDRVVLWAGGSAGGLWRRRTFLVFQTWDPLSSALPGSPSVGAFAVHPLDSSRILIGTGDRGREVGTGMYRTTNGGSTWTLTSLAPIPSSFERIVFDVRDATRNTVVASGSTGVFRSTDFGASWTRLYNGNTSDLAQDPLHPYIWYAAVPGQGVRRSRWESTLNFDELGTGITGAIGRVAIAVCASAPQYVYAVAENTSGSGLLGIYRSSFYAEQFVSIETAGVDTISGGQAFHTTSIGVDPRDPNRLFVGMAGVQTSGNATAQDVCWRRNVGGSCAGCCSEGFDVDIGHADITTFLFVPESLSPGNTTVWVANDGGIYSYDWTTNALSANVNLALALEQVVGMGLAASRSNPNVLHSGLQDNGFVRLDTAASPAAVFKGDTFGTGADGGPMSVAPGDPNLVYGSVGAPFVRVRSADGGTSWTNALECSLAQLWAPVLMHDPFPGTATIYTHDSSYVYKKYDGTSCDWTAVNPTHPFPAGWSAKQIDAGLSLLDYVFYATAWNSPRLLVMDSSVDGEPGAMSWEDRTPAVGLGNDALVYAERSTSRPNVVYYVSASGRPSRLYLSVDRGAHWSNVTGDLATKLPDATYWELVANPANLLQLFVATDVGVFRSDDFGAHWYRYMSGLPRVVKASSLELSFDAAPQPVLRLGTWGIGWWQRTIEACAPPGDANGDCKRDVSDVFYLINYLFAGGSAPSGVADANGDGVVDVRDVFYLINYLFAAGPPPP